MRRNQPKAFISYSHADSIYLDKLHKHLAQMRRNGEILDWSDHEIHAGSNIDSTIDGALNDSNLFLALLSADYLNSKYCYEKEFQKALAMSKEKVLTIVPIICRSCDWQNSPFSELLALPKDGKPIVQWQSEDTAFFNVIQQLRKLTDSLNNPDQEVIEDLDLPSQSKRQYQVKKDFDKIQKLEFLDKIFSDSVLALKANLKEVATVENVKYRITEDTKDSFHCILVNRDKEIAEAELEYQKGRMIIHDTFDFNRGDLNASFKAQQNHINKSFNLKWDDYRLHLQRRSGFNSDGKTFHDSAAVAEEIWRQWLNLIGVSFE